MRRCVKELERVQAELVVVNAKVVRPNDVNENIELDTFVKVCAELMKKFKEGKTTHWNPDKAMH